MIGMCRMFSACAKAPVASWYLPTYLGWRRAIERLGITPERCLQTACRGPST
jgi:hypothetical protein